MPKVFVGDVCGEGFGGDPDVNGDDCDCVCVSCDD